MPYLPAFPKPEPRRREKRREQDAETRVKTWVRARVVARDGRCRLAGWPQAQVLFGACRGAAEWAHLGAFRRSKTIGQDPEARHRPEGSLMLCASHHRTGPWAYDRHRVDIEPLSSDGADGRLRFVSRDRTRQCAEPA